MSTRSSLPGRHKPFVPAAGLREAPDVTQALAKAEYNAARARSAKTDQDREYYERMGRTWLGIAQAWRVIADVGEQSERGPPETR